MAAKMTFEIANEIKALFFNQILIVIINLYVFMSKESTSMRRFCIILIFYYSQQIKKIPHNDK